MKSSVTLSVVILACSGALAVGVILSRRSGERVALAEEKDGPRLDTTILLERSETPTRSEEPVSQAPVSPTEEVPTTQPRSADDPRTLPETSLSEMKAKFERLRSQLDEASLPLLKQRFTDNLGVKLWDAHEYSGLPEDETDVYAIQMIPGQGTFRAVLPPAEHPELYELKGEIRRLKDGIREVTFAELREQHEAARRK